MSYDSPFGLLVLFLVKKRHYGVNIVLTRDQFSPRTSSRKLTFNMAEPCIIILYLSRTSTRRELVACQNGIYNSNAEH